VCPTPAIVETSHISAVYRGLAQGKVLCAILDPAVCVGIGELSDSESGEDMTGKTIGALKALGFQHVFDLRTMIDLVAAEIAEDFLKSKKRPYVLATCPALVNFVEKTATDFLANLSEIKTPAQCLALAIGRVFPGVEQEKLQIIQITPCIAAKEEIQRMQFRGVIDAVLTVREVGQLLNQFGIERRGVVPGTFESGWTFASKKASAALVPGGWVQAILSVIFTRRRSRHHRRNSCCPFARATNAFFTDHSVWLNIVSRSHCVTDCPPDTNFSRARIVRIAI
jgi:iron only hydrogenase large subunit-like protein